VKEFETNRTDSPVCPHCGHKDDNGWELHLMEAIAWK